MNKFSKLSISQFQSTDFPGEVRDLIKKVHTVLLATAQMKVRSLFFLLKISISVLINDKRIDTKNLKFFKIHKNNLVFY